MKLADEAIDVALEHVRWCQANAVSIPALLEEIGHVGSVDGGDALIGLIARTWLPVAYAGISNETGPATRNRARRDTLKTLGSQKMRRDAAFVNIGGAQ